MDLTRRLSLVCLGTGHGASMVYDGVCSASYVLCFEHEPILLIGAGYGVAQQCLKYFGKIPPDVFVFSNRSHYAAELPVLLGVEANEGTPLRLLSHSGVLSRIEAHRLAEVHQVMMLQRQLIDSLVNLQPVLPVAEWNRKDEAAEAHASGVVLQGCPFVTIRCFVTNTTEMSAGLLVYSSFAGGAPLMAITGDCSYDATLFRELVHRFPVVVADGRKSSSTDHCSFEEVREAAQLDGCIARVCIGHYGTPADAPENMSPASPTTTLLEGTVLHVTIENEQGAHGQQFKITVKVSLLSTVRVPKDVVAEATVSTQKPQPLEDRRGRQGNGSHHRTASLTRATPKAMKSSFHVDASLEVAPSVSNAPSSSAKRIYVFSNEDKSAPGRLLMVQTFRSVQQVKLKIAELLQLKPIGDLYLVPSGEMIFSLDQLHNGNYVVATKIGGEVFSLQSLPLVLRGKVHSGGNTTVGATRQPTEQIDAPSKVQSAPAIRCESVSPSVVLERAAPPSHGPLDDYMNKARSALGGKPSTARDAVVVVDPSTSRHLSGDVVVAGPLPRYRNDDNVYNDGVTLNTKDGPTVGRQREAATGKSATGREAATQSSSAQVAEQTSSSAPTAQQRRQRRFSMVSS